MNNNTAIVVGVLVVVVAGISYWAFMSPGTQSPSTVIPMPQGPLNSGENPPPGTGGVHNQPVEPAAAAARADLAAKLGVSEGSIVIMQVEEKTWSDGCLGLGGPAESCIAALTDGFKVEMEVRGESYTYRTDKTGSQVRAEAN